MNPISFIYFDVGGVAIKDFSDTPQRDTLDYAKASHELASYHQNLPS